MRLDLGFIKMLQILGRQEKRREPYLLYGERLFSLADNVDEVFLESL